MKIYARVWRHFFFGPMSTLRTSDNRLQDRPARHILDFIRQRAYTFFDGFLQNLCLPLIEIFAGNAFEGTLLFGWGARIAVNFLRKASVRAR